MSQVVSLAMASHLTMNQKKRRKVRLEEIGRDVRSKKGNTNSKLLEREHNQKQQRRRIRIQL